MIIEGEYIFNGPQEAVWEIVRDPEVLVTALPGAKSLDKVGENEYEGEMNVRIGPVAGLFSGRLVVSKEVAPESCTLTVEGKGAMGFANGSGNVLLIDQGAGKTLMKYDGEMNVGGKLASVGQRLLDTASKSIIKQGLEALDAALQARVAAAQEGVKVEYQPPTETEFAAAVAKDMAGQMLSPRNIAIAAAVIAILAIIIILLTNGG